ncbi:MAG: hypothetical protein QOF55_635, partial [Thermoleophilaceae bacterium]|nr:hypothetical protein [Thermoleophilaceae bacterium]
MRKPLLAVAAAVALAAPATAATAPAAPGPQGLDTRFGNCGVITPPLPRNFSGAQRLARAPGGAIVAAGTATLRLKGSVIHPDTFVVTRFSADGVLDTGFGGGDGVVTLKVPRPSGAGDAQLTGLAVDAGGKVVVSGYVQLADPSRSRSLLARYNPDGTLDSSFGSGGIADDALPAANSGEIDDIALAPGGGLFAAGGRDPGGFTVARYRPDGTLDPAFGSGGVATLDPGIGGSHAFVVRVLADGRVLAGGQAGAQYELVRLLPTGMADPSFGNGGVTVESPPAAGAISALAPLGDGRVLAAGTASNINGRDQLALARYGADGHADTGF